MLIVVEEANLLVQFVKTINFNDIIFEHIKDDVSELVLNLPWFVNI